MIKTRTFEMFIYLGVLFCTNACEPPPDEIGGLPTAAGSNDSWWGSMSQGERNLHIINRAHSELHQYTGKSCKEWVRSVVSSASRGSATVPSSCSWQGGHMRDGSGWYWCVGGNAQRLVTVIRNVQPGWIVQMRLRNKDGSSGPHTAIVYSRTRDGVWWIDSNWNHKTQVQLRFQTFDSFEAMTTYDNSSWYSVYQISGG